MVRVWVDVQLTALVWVAWMFGGMVAAALASLVPVVGKPASIALAIVAVYGSFVVAWLYWRRRRERARVSG